jgi:hypothetical protein
MWGFFASPETDSQHHQRKADSNYQQDDFYIIRHGASPLLLTIANCRNTRQLCYRANRPTVN